ncbi:ABC transporter ATP-binding protein, partial [bacterium]|nr:ABC transporter ATP-binding protein [bacterium]
EFLSIIGRSGSGKSTLLYQMGLLDHPTSGDIFIDGENVTNLYADDRTKYRLHNLGYVFQDYALIPTLNAVENVAVPLIMKGYSISESYKMAGNALDEVGLSKKYNNLPNMLSGGEQQRVSIARALAGKPKILFADEPTANLDTETSKVVLNTFIDLNNKGQTIIMVTHEKEFAVIGDRTLELKDGEIIKISKNVHK